MPAFVLPLAIGILVILGCEGLLWMLFRRRLRGILLPHELDASSLRFLTLWRLRIIAFLHTVSLLVLLTLSLAFLW